MLATDSPFVYNQQFEASHYTEWEESCEPGNFHIVYRIFLSIVDAAMCLIPQVPEIRNQKQCLTFGETKNLTLLKRESNFYIHFIPEKCMHVHIPKDKKQGNFIIFKLRLQKNVLHEKRKLFCSVLKIKPFTPLCVALCVCVC